jgi:hypothetical protein
MRRLLAATIAATSLTLAVSLSGAVFAADADPTVHEIYEAAQGGHLDQAQQMMDKVLMDHPKSAKAHYVQAELYAKEGKLSLARAELGQAEQFDPGLPHENPRSVQELKSQLGMSPAHGPRVIGMTSGSPAPHFPWGTVLVLLVAVALLWMLFRRRSSYAQYPGGMPATGGAPGAPGYGGPGYGGPGYGGPGGGMGSGIAGGLASGLAVGAGVVAGEELAHHFLDGNRHDGTVLPPANDDSERSSNGDMGGSDFGVDDPGSGWDDSSGGGGGGGDDWS